MAITCEAYEGLQSNACSLYKTTKCKTLSNRALFVASSCKCNRLPLTQGIFFSNLMRAIIEEIKMMPKTKKGHPANNRKQSHSTNCGDC